MTEKEQETKTLLLMVKNQMEQGVLSVELFENHRASLLSSENLKIEELIDFSEWKRKKRNMIVKAAFHAIEKGSIEGFSKQKRKAEIIKFPFEVFFGIENIENEMVEKEGEEPFIDPEENLTDMESLQKLAEYEQEEWRAFLLRMQKENKDIKKIIVKALREKRIKEAKENLNKIYSTIKKVITSILDLITGRKTNK